MNKTDNKAVRRRLRQRRSGGRRLERNEGDFHGGAEPHGNAPILRPLRHVHVTAGPVPVQACVERVGEVGRDDHREELPCMSVTWQHRT